MSLEIPARVDVEHRRCTVGNEPLIFHCHHFNTFLQRTIRDAEFIDSDGFLVDAAAEVAHAQLTQVFADKAMVELRQRCVFAEELLRWAGLGTVSLKTLGESGGTVSTPNSHYAFGWRAKFGQAPSQVCFFMSGWIAGALAAIYDKPSGHYVVSHPRCMAVEADAACVFSVAPRGRAYVLSPSVGVGPLTQHRLREVPPNGVDYDGIFRAVNGMPLVGNAEGQIPAFGVYLTRHYANYYNRISFEFLRRAMELFGDEGRKAVEPLLIEAGHVCAFHTFGGIMTSTEWDALIRPNLRTREDWVHGMVAVVNTLGWGRWQVTEVSEEQATFVLHDDYESVGHLAMYGTSAFPVSYLAQGGVVGLMNLVYAGNIEKRPELSPLFYNHMFKSGGGYRAEPVASRAMGDDVTSFRVTRS